MYSSKKTPLNLKPVYILSLPYQLIPNFKKKYSKIREKITKIEQNDSILKR